MGRGSGASGARGGGGGSSVGVKNSSGASAEAVGFIEEARNQIGKYGVAQVVINETKSTSYSGSPKASNPANASMEKQLKGLASENGLSISFQTKTTASSGVKQALTYGYSQSKTQTKQRIMYAYKA